MLCSLLRLSCRKNAYDVKTTSILYLFLVAKPNPYFKFPNLRHQNNWFPNIAFGIVQPLSSTCNGLFQTNVKGWDFERL